MAIPLDAAAAALREAMRETVKRYSLWYLLQGVLMVVAGVLALVYPLLASVTLIYLLAWVLIISGAVQAIGLIGARHVPHYWLQLISVVLAILIGVLLLRQPESGLLIMTLLLIVFFMSRASPRSSSRSPSGPSPIGAGFSRAVSSASCSASIC